MSREWNPRYEAYAFVHGETPESMLAADKERWPGGCMCGFTLWISQCWQAWCEATGTPERYAGLHQREFDEWLPGNARPLAD